MRFADKDQMCSLVVPVTTVMLVGMHDVTSLLALGWLDRSDRYRSRPASLADATAYFVVLSYMVNDANREDLPRLYGKLPGESGYARLATAPVVAGHLLPEH